VEPDAAATGTVSVHVAKFGTPIANATVVFSLPSGEVGSTAMTNATGDATGTITAGGSVTAEYVTGTQPNELHTLMTAFAVQPGDQLTLGEASGPPPQGASLGSVQVTYPATVTNAVSYTTDIACASSTAATTAQVTLAIAAGCLSTSGTFDVISTAVDVDGNLLAYSVVANLTPPGSGNTLNQTMPAWRTDPATATITLSNAEPNQVVAARPALYDGPGLYSKLPAVNTVADNTGHATVAPAWPKSVGSAVSWYVRAIYPSSVAGQPEKFYEERTTALNATTRGIDLAALPLVTTRTAEVASGRDTPFLSWTATGPATGAQGTFAQVDWSISGIGDYDWTAILPVDAVSVQFPRLPDSLAVDRVSVTQAFSDETIYIVQSNLFADAAAYRQSWGNIVVPPGQNYTLALSGIQ